MLNERSGMNLLLNIVRTAQYPAFDLISPLPRHECVRRLREKTDPPRSHSTIYVLGFKIYESAARVNPKPLTGYIGENDLHIAKQIEGGMRDALHPDNASLTINLFGWV